MLKSSSTTVTPTGTTTNSISVSFSSSASFSASLSESASQSASATVSASLSAISSSPSVSVSSTTSTSESRTPSGTLTSSESVTESFSESGSLTGSVSVSITNTVSQSPSQSASSSASISPSESTSQSVTRTVTRSASGSITSIETITQSLSPDGSVTRTATSTATPTPSGGFDIQTTTVTPTASFSTSRSLSASESASLTASASSTPSSSQGKEPNVAGNTVNPKVVIPSAVAGGILFIAAIAAAVLLYKSRKIRIAHAPLHGMEMTNAGLEQPNIMRGGIPPMNTRAAPRGNRGRGRIDVTDLDDRGGGSHELIIDVVEGEDSKADDMREAGHADDEPTATPVEFASSRPRRTAADVIDTEDEGAFRTAMDQQLGYARVIRTPRQVTQTAVVPAPVASNRTPTPEGDSSRRVTPLDNVPRTGTTK